MSQPDHAQPGRPILNQDQLRNLWGPGQNSRVDPVVQKVLKNLKTVTTEYPTERRSVCAGPLCLCLGCWGSRPACRSITDDFSALSQMSLEVLSPRLGDRHLGLPCFALLSPSVHGTRWEVRPPAAQQVLRDIGHRDEHELRWLSRQGQSCLSRTRVPVHKESPAGW